MRDYYEVLGVSREATTEEIRRAYRKRARELHPDYAGVESEEQFKELSVAYETLSDPQKRERYDLGGPMNGSPGSAGYSGFGFTDLFGAMFESMGGFSSGSSPRQTGRPGRDTTVAVEITLKDVVFGTSKQVLLDTAMVCATCEGSCCAPGTSPQTCSTCGGQGSVIRVQQSLLGELRMSVPCSACGGLGRTIPDPCPECRGEGRVRAARTVDVEIPSGVAQGTRLRMRGKGEAGAQGGESGDLYIEIRIKPDPLFARSGHDLHTTIQVPMTTAALGATIPLVTFDGDRDVFVPAGTQPGDEIILKGLGVRRAHSTSRGDLRVSVGISIPKKMDQRSKELLEELANHRGEEFGERPDAKSGLFGRLKDKLAG